MKHNIVHCSSYYEDCTTFCALNFAGEFRVVLGKIITEFMLCTCTVDLSMEEDFNSNILGAKYSVLISINNKQLSL